MPPDARHYDILRRWPGWVYPPADLCLRLAARLKGRTYPLHRGEAYSPIFIVGAPRSGNTLLRRVLTATRQIHIPPETYVLARVIRTYRHNHHRTWPFVVGPVLALFEFHPEFDWFGASLRPLFERLLTVPEDSRSLAFILDALYRHDGERTGEQCLRWGDKTPLNVYCLPELLQVFPHARFIHMLRDGVDSVHSMQVKADFQEPLRHAAERWRTSVAHARKFIRRNPLACHEVRYENLVRDPHATVRPLCEWLGMTYDGSMVESLEHGESLRDVSSHAHYVNVMKPIMTDSIGKGRREMNAADRRALQCWIGRSLAQLGYDPIA